MQHQTLSPADARRLVPARPRLSIVVPAFNEEGSIADAIKAIDDTAARLVDSHEIILVDDGSTDRTLERARALCDSYPLRVLRLSRNFGKEQAIMAGLCASNGAQVATLDADMQEPITALEVMLAHLRDGYEMAYAVRAHRRDEGRAKRVLTRAFYRLISWGSDVIIPPDARDFRVMDRKVVDALCALPERNRFMKGLYGWVGFRSIAVPVELQPRATGTSKFGLKGLMRLATTGLTSFTDWPLRVWTGIGFSVAVFSLLYGAWIAAKTLVFGVDVPGWSTLAVGTFFLGGVQLISIGILGEYLGRVFTEVKARPGYLVAEEISAEQAR
jgi:glycosyltransferase involved in cell wall biosynthesis